MEKKFKIRLPAEWEQQSGVMLTWPHENTDWKDILGEVEECFINLAREISLREKLLIVCADKKMLVNKLRSCNPGNLIFAEIPSNDTWARDHGPITVMINDKPVLYDFTFNGWGMKFAANLDNQITANLFSPVSVFPFPFSLEVSYSNQQSFVLEGGSIEPDGKGTLLTTRECLCSVNRNNYMSREEIEKYLTDLFNLKKVLWLNHGFLEGDDTDSHIDTLARLCDESTITYVKCEDPDDVHYEELKKMEEELKSFTNSENQPYRLIPLPMADPIYDEGQRLPATYANFLIINRAVLVPFYNSPKDIVVKNILQKIFPEREIIGIDCRSLIKQHGSLHCVTMQFPGGVINDYN
jgi:agmatine/peptidylarginine deiminase